jgi:hypothetical protein
MIALCTKCQAVQEFNGIIDYCYKCGATNIISDTGDYMVAGEIRKGGVMEKIFQKISRRYREIKFSVWLRYQEIRKQIMQFIMWG